MEHHPRQKRLVLFITLVIVLLAILWLVAASYYAGLDIVFRADVRDRARYEWAVPEFHGQFEDWNSRPLTFPPEALSAEPFDPELRDAAEKALSEYEKIRDPLTAWLPSVLTDPNLTEPPSLEIDAAVAAFEAYVNRPDFDYGAMDATGGMNRDWLYLQTMAKTLRWESNRLSLDGRHEAALAKAETIVRAARADVYDALINPLVALAICNIGTDAWSAAVARCDDPALLRDSLKRQNELAAQLPRFPPGITVDILDYFGAFRAAQRQGMPLDIQGRTGRELRGEAWRVMEQIAGFHFNERSAEEIRLERIIRRDWPIPIPDAMTQLTVRYAYFRALPNDLEARTRGKVALTQFDLLRVKTATKLYEIEYEAPPDSPEALVPDYLPSAPVDVFSPDGEWIKLDAAGAPYSIGPDQTDDQGTIPYDTTNGTISKADILTR